MNIFFLVLYILSLIVGSNACTIGNNEVRIKLKLF